MPKPLISIVTPFKNTSKYLAECIESIIHQTYTNWELLIVDDDSSDESYAIVKKFAAQDKRIKLLKNPDNGIIEALRFAYQNSSGKLITRMDSDDIMLPNKLKVLSDLLLLNGRNHIATGQVIYFSENGIGEGYKNYEIWLNKLILEGTHYSEIYKECVIPSPSWMLFREDFDTIEAFNPDRYPEDYDMAFRCLEHQLKCIPCETVVHKWRDYSTRTSRTHEHYKVNSFLHIKLHYFLKLNYDVNRPLAIWGAGSRGKDLAKLLIKQDIPFYWICNNPKKIGRDIYDQRLLDFNYLKELKNPQSIITVANPQAQLDIKDIMVPQKMKPMVDYFFFC